MSRIDALIALVSGTTLTAFVGLVLYAVLAAVGVLDSGSVGATDGAGYGAGLTASAEAGGDASYARHEAILDGETAHYLDFGTGTSLTEDGTVSVAPIWVFIEGFEADGSPRMSPHLQTVVDVVPGDSDYSDLWDVQFVLVPADYDGPAIHSLADLNASGLETMASGMLVNCPLVADGTTTSEGHATRPGWYRGEPIAYFDFGMSATEPGDVYEFVAEQSGGYGYGAPTVERLNVPPLIVLPESDGPPAQFFRLHEVMLPSDIALDEVRSADDLTRLDLSVRDTGKLVNRPLVGD